MLPFRDINPTRNFPLVTISLIVINTLVFLYMLSLQAQSADVLEQFVTRAALTPQYLTTGHAPAEVMHPIWLTVFTAMFLHGGPVHLAGNMLYLWIFGNNVEDIMGPVRFVCFYLLCGVVAALAQVAVAPHTLVPMLGASGAIAGVLGAYLVRFPTAQVETCIFFIFVTIVRLPAIIVLGFWFLLQFSSGIAALHGAPTDSGVAVWAHIGGFLAGMLLVNLFAQRPRARYNEWG